MIRFRIFSNLEKEEEWLNKLSAEGWAFDSKNLCIYKFKKTECVDAVYKIDCRVFSNKSDYLEYLSLFADAGWRHISGSRFSGYQYFDSTLNNGNCEIFSDAETKAARYHRLSRLSAFSFLLAALLLVATIFNARIDLPAMLRPSSFYYTPGLWSREGISFWIGFLVETPFALMRGYGWLLAPLIMIASFFQFIKAQKSIRQ